MKPLSIPGSKRLKLKDDELLSSFAFSFNLRRYIWGSDGTKLYDNMVRANALTDAAIAGTTDGRGVIQKKPSTDVQSPPLPLLSLLLLLLLLLHLLLLHHNAV